MAAIWSSTTEDGLRRQSPIAVVGRCAVVLSALVVLPPLIAAGEGFDGGKWNGYQRKSHFADPWKGGPWRNDWKRGHFRATGPNISSGTFQRPYPYHLDYYKMKYGGSYAPYFGNLYGPPTFVGSPFYGFGGYGTFNPYLGAGFEGGYWGYPPGGVGYPTYYPNAPCVGPNCPDAGGHPAVPHAEGEAIDKGNSDGQP